VGGGGEGILIFLDFGYSQCVPNMFSIALYFVPYALSKLSSWNIFGWATTHFVSLEGSSQFWLWKIHTHLLTFCFLYHLLTCAPSWTNFVTTKLDMKILSPIMVMAPIISKNLHNSFKMWQCDWKHSNTHFTKSLFCFGLKFCTNVKNKYEKRTFDHFFFCEKSH